MKFLTIILTSFIFFLVIFGCNISEKTVGKQEVSQSIVIDNMGDQIISVTKGSSFNHPTFVIWTEDLQGNYLSTIYITKAYAKGIYSHELVNDSLWINREGPSYQPAALPYWTYKKGTINNHTLVPDARNPYVDAYSGATPSTNFSIQSNSYSTNNSYRLLLEINQRGDWNSYWTNNKFPQSVAYKHSAQPSLIYAVVIDNSSSDYFLNPIGHGDPLGISDKLFTNLSTITTAKDILREIEVSIGQNN